MLNEFAPLPGGDIGNVISIDAQTKIVVNRFFAGHARFFSMEPPRFKSLLTRDNAAKVSHQ